MKVVLYPRVSSKSQLEGDSIEAQTLRLTNFCKDKGHEIIDIYTDGGKSASIDEDSLNQSISGDYFNNSFKLSKRPGFKKLLQEAKEKKFDAIIFFRWDRYSRDIAFADLSVRYFNKYGIKLIPTDDSEDPFVSSIMQVVNKQEVEKMKFRVLQTRLYRFNNGIMPGRSPFGYEPIRKDKKIIGFKPKTKEANVVKKAFEMAIKGIDYKLICKELGLAPQSYYNIIRNPVYAGFVTFEGKIKKGVHIPLITFEQFKQLNPNFHENP